jgi:hypothetical protein
MMLSVIIFLPRGDSGLAAQFRTVFREKNGTDCASYGTAPSEAGRLTVAEVYTLRSICRRLRVVFEAAAGLAGQGLRQLVFFPALLIMIWGALAESPEDYKYPIGKIEAQIRCKQDRHEATEDALTGDAACMKEFGDIVARSGDDLIIKLDNNKTKVIRGNAKACQQGPVDDCVVYKLVGFIGRPRQFLLRRLLYESVFVDLVSRRTGTVTKLEGYPHLSPNGKQFVTVAASDAWTIESPIAIYSNTDPPKVVWRFPQPSEYEQYSFDGWNGEDRVRLHTISKPFLETDVRRAPGGWILRRPNGKVSSGTSFPSAPRRTAP